MSSDLAILTATELVAGFNSGDFSPVEVVGRTPENIAALNPALNAFV